jgi:hypothetical protein
LLLSVPAGVTDLREKDPCAAARIGDRFDSAGAAHESSMSGGRKDRAAVPAESQRVEAANPAGDRPRCAGLTVDCPQASIVRRRVFPKQTRAVLRPGDGSDPRRATRQLAQPGAVGLDNPIVAVIA